MPRKTIPLEVRFWRRVDRSGGPAACWPWTGTLRPDGYGVIGRGRRTEGLARTHRLAWELLRGPVTDGLFLCHRCDMPACCNPAHMFIGTAKDNHEDMRSKGRESNPPVRYGTSNQQAKLGPRQVRAVRRMRLAGATLAEIGRRFGVTRYCIGHIVSGNTWRHVR